VTARGTLGMPVISVAQMIELYQGGMSLIDVSLRARLNYRAVRILLEGHGVRLRTRKETQQLQMRKRAPWRALLPADKGGVT
jgi:hypothetical protein